MIESVKPHTAKFMALLWILLIASGCTLNQTKLYDLSPDVGAFFKKNDNGKWGISLEQNGKLLAFNREPLNIEVYQDDEVIKELKAGYDKFSSQENTFIAEGTIKYNQVTFYVTDKWSQKGDILIVDRNLKVLGNAAGGFMSSIQFSLNDSGTRDSFKLFAPGMIYGPTQFLTNEAIGGSVCKDFIRIREDRLPAPLFGIFSDNAYSVTLLNSSPDGRTTVSDSHDMDASTIIDSQMRFGAIGAEFNNEKPLIGYWFPGSEGGITYKGRTYPYGQMKAWSRRYHPIEDGLEQTYQISIRIGSDKQFREYYSDTWRWSWETLKPEVNYHDIELVKRVVLDALANNVEVYGSFTGIRNSISAVKGDKHKGAPKTVMGFTGKALETARFLLTDTLTNENPQSQTHRELGEGIITTFLNLNLSPPDGEGFTFDGKPVFARNPSKVPEPTIYLRSFGDGLKELLKAVATEKDAHIEHEDWVKWAKSFADWLLPQQNAEGGFPRTWQPKTGKVLDPSPESSYTVIQFLILLSQLTDETQYAEAALKAAEFCWNTSQKEGMFIGGTIDNPNVIDKEAGTISLEAYLALYNYTMDKKWLERAIIAANFAETWIYIWNVPMPEGENDNEIPWKKSQSTIGMQLISTGHSLTDQYMAFDVDEFAELYLKTGNRHYYDVAMILLHNTKAMLALPGREFDLKGPGWMQEHWSIAPVRGYGMHRGWLPWVSTSLLNGIFELEELNPDLYMEMKEPKQ